MSSYDFPIAMADPEITALKEIFNSKRFSHIAGELAAIYPGFDTARFLTLSLPGLEALTLLQRLRRMTECLHATLPPNYPKALKILRKLAPRIQHGFATLVIRLPVPKWDPIRDAAHPGRQFDVHDNDYVEFEVLPWTDSRGVISARWVLRGVVAV